MEIKLDYIPEKVYRVFQGKITEYVRTTISVPTFKYHVFDSYKHLLFVNEKGDNKYVGRYRREDMCFYMGEEFFLTKKEAYDAYVKELENQIKELNDRVLQIQMEALDIVGDLDNFMEYYKDL